MTAKQTDEQSYWVIFAGVILFIAGSLGFFYGLGAVLNDEAITVQGRGVIVGNFTAWGWVHMVIGLIMVLTSAGLLMGLGWARIAAVIFATSHAVAQVGLITANPLWSVLLISLDVIVIYQLIVHWVPVSSLEGT